MEYNIRLLGWHNFLTDFRLYGPFIVIYFAEVSGSWTLAMMALSIMMVTSAALEIPTGILSDRIGRKKTLAAGSLFSALAVATYAIAPSFALLALGACSKAWRAPFLPATTRLYFMIRPGRRRRSMSTITCWGERA